MIIPALTVAVVAAILIGSLVFGIEPRKADRPVPAPAAAAPSYVSAPVDTDAP